MKTVRNVLVVVILVACLAIMGCDENSLLTGEGGPPPALPSIAFKGPQTTSTNPEALNTKSAVDAMNGFSSYFLIFSGVTPKDSGGVFTWTYLSQALTIRLVATKQQDGGFAWKIIYNGTNSQNKTYTNWTSVDGTTSSDTKSANWVVYEDNTTLKAADFVWSTSTSNSVSGSYKLYANSALSSQLSITSNTDNTGEFRQSDDLALIYRSTWLANGSGQWWRYDRSGQITSSGSW